MRILLFAIAFGLCCCSGRKANEEPIDKVNNDSLSSRDSSDETVNEVKSNTFIKEIIEFNGSDSLFKTVFKRIDLGDLFVTKDFSFNGSIGKTYKRIRIYISKAARTDEDNSLYNIDGKTNVNSNVCRFKGKIRIEQVTKNDSYAEEEVGPPSEVMGHVYGSFEFFEDSTQNGSGIMRGTFSIGWNIEGDRIVLGDVWYTYATSVLSFSGIWTSYKTAQSQDLCWSNYIPPCLPHDFDCSDGPDLIPCDKYASNGWESLRDIFSSDEQIRQSVIKSENFEWWE